MWNYTAPHIVCFLSDKLVPGNQSVASSVPIGPLSCYVSWSSNARAQFFFASFRFLCHPKHDQQALIFPIAGLTRMTEEKPQIQKVSNIKHRVQPSSVLQNVQDGKTLVHWCSDNYRRQFAHMIVSEVCSTLLQSLYYQTFLLVARSDVHQMPPTTPSFPLVCTRIISEKEVVRWLRYTKHHICWIVFHTILLTAYKRARQYKSE